MKSLIDKYFLYQFWHIGILVRPIFSLLSNPKIGNEEIIWLPRGKFSYYADPFGFFDGSNYYILYENYQFFKKKGRIDYIKLDKNFNIIESGKSFESKNHLSFPFLFLEDGEIFMIPECYRNGSIQAFKAVDFPKKWECHRTIFDGEAIDPVLTKFQGKYYLFFSMPKGSFIYSSNEFFGKYKQIAMSKTAIQSAGEIFSFNDELYRPIQISKNSYGEGIEICKLNIFGDNVNSDVVVEIFPPSNSKYNLGIHTISSLGDYTLIDTKGEFYSILKPIYSIARSVIRPILKLISCIYRN